MSKLEVQRYGAYQDTQKPGTYHVWDHQTDSIVAGSETNDLMAAEANAYNYNKQAIADGLNGTYEVEDHPIYHPRNNKKNTNQFEYKEHTVQFGITGWFTTFNPRFGFLRADTEDGIKKLINDAIKNSYQHAKR